MKVVVFEPDYNSKHQIVLRAFAEGIPGAIVRPVTRYEPCDIAVIFGGVKKTYKPTWSKQAIIDRHCGRRLIMVESAFVRRGEYYQVGYGGTAGFADFNIDFSAPLDRWESIGTALPWRTKPKGPIVVCGQLPRDVQVQDTDHTKWCRRMVEYFDALKLPVVFRPHPKIDSPTEYGVPVEFIDTRPLVDMLEAARCFVTWNSTSGVDAAIAGVPVVVMGSGSMAAPVASRSLTALDMTPDRRNWLARIGYAQWTLEEMRQGLPWRHLTRQ